MFINLAKNTFLIISLLSVSACSLIINSDAYLSENDSGIENDAATDDGGTTLCNETCAEDSVCVDGECYDCDSDDDGYYSQSQSNCLNLANGTDEDCDDNDSSIYPTTTFPTCGGITSICPSTLITNLENLTSLNQVGIALPTLIYSTESELPNEPELQLNIAVPGPSYESTYREAAPWTITWVNDGEAWRARANPPDSSTDGLATIELDAEMIGTNNTDKWHFSSGSIAGLQTLDTGSQRYYLLTGEVAAVSVPRIYVEDGDDLKVDRSPSSLYLTNWSRPVRIDLIDKSIVAATMTDLSFSSVNLIAWNDETSSQRIPTDLETNPFYFGFAGGIALYLDPSNPENLFAIPYGLSSSASVSILDLGEGTELNGPIQFASNANIDRDATNTGRYIVSTDQGAATGLIVCKDDDEIDCELSSAAIDNSLDLGDTYDIAPFGQGRFILAHVKEVNAAETVVVRFISMDGNIGEATSFLPYAYVNETKYMIDTVQSIALTSQYDSLGIDIGGVAQVELVGLDGSYIYIFGMRLCNE